MAKVDKKLLSTIVNATNAGSHHYVSQAEGLPLVKNDPPLIEVNPAQVDPTDPTKIAARATEHGKALVGTGNHTPSLATFEIMSGVELPPRKRGGGGAGAPTIYPFDKLEVGQGFFVPATDKRPDPAKSLQSSVSAANDRYATETGETKQVSRAKRDPADKKKALKGADGKNIMETVTLPVKHYNRKFVIAPFTNNGVEGAFVKRES